MKSKRLTSFLTALARVLLGLWFVYSGGVKILVSGLDRFTRDISNYRLVGPPLDMIAAYTVPWFEIIAGACLVLGLLRRGALLTLAGLVVVFCTCIGWAWAHQLDISCGCHGGNAPIQYWNKVAEFTGYFLLLAWLWKNERKQSLDSVSVP
jgi:uncharacterized membrane protein YphA (DoxX/SURF4 family)